MHHYVYTMHQTFQASASKESSKHDQTKVVNLVHFLRAHFFIAAVPVCFAWRSIMDTLWLMHNPFSQF